jgi:hypothetical protein
MATKFPLLVNPNNPVVILHSRWPHLVPIEGAVLFELPLSEMMRHCKYFPHVSKMPTLTYNRANNIIIKNTIILNILHNTEAKIQITRSAIVVVIVWYLFSQCLSPLTLWVGIPLRRGVLETTLCDQVCQWFAKGRWLSSGTSVFSTNKTDLWQYNFIFEFWIWLSCVEQQCISCYNSLVLLTFVSRSSCRFT